MFLGMVQGRLELVTCDDDDSFEGVVELWWNCCFGISSGGIVGDVVN